MLFTNVEELVLVAEKRDKKIFEIMIEQEEEITGFSKQEILKKMKSNFIVMKNAVNEGIKGVKSKSGLTGNDAKKLYDYIQEGNFITDKTLLKSICYAIATNEVNASMGLICATPTAGSAGVLPGTLIALQEKYSFSDDIIINHLFSAGAFGFIVANNSSISGAAGGCQAEIGTASAMTAGAITELLGGNPRQSANAMAMALKNMLGLTCDPVAGLVEVPCIKRNAAGASNALMAAEMALSGIVSKIPCDEVITTMKKIGQSMPISLRETSTGGLAVTKTGIEIKQKLNT